MIVDAVKFAESTNMKVLVNENGDVTTGFFHGANTTRAFIDKANRSPEPIDVFCCRPSKYDFEAQGTCLILPIKEIKSQERIILKIICKTKIWIHFHSTCLDGTVEQTACGNQIDCCEVCDPYNENNMESDCLAVLFDDFATFEEAENLCKLTVAGNADYCHQIPEGILCLGCYVLPDFRITTTLYSTFVNPAL